MKKRILASLLTLCMVLTLLPAMAPAAKAAPGGAPTEVWVNGENIVNSGTATCGGGTATYNKSANILTLDGATIDKTYSINGTAIGLYANGDLTIHLVNSNSITLDMNSQQGASVNGNLTFSGSGSLTVQAVAGIGVIGSFTVPKGVSLSITATMVAISCENVTFGGVSYTGWHQKLAYDGAVLRFPLSKLYVNGVDMLGGGAPPANVTFNAATSTLTLNGATINTATSASENSGIYADSDLTIHLAGTNTVNSSGASGYGIYAVGALTFTGDASSKLTVTATDNAITANGDIIMRSGTEITATSATSSAIADRPPEATTSIIIEAGAKVTAETKSSSDEALHATKSITIGGILYSGTDQKITYDGVTFPFPPKVVSVSPNGTSTPTSGSIAITFDMPMKANAGTVKLNELTALTGGTWSNGNKTYTIPYSGLEDSTPYTVKIENFQGATGNVLALDNAHNFTTTKKAIVSDKISLATPNLTYNGQEQDCGDATITGIAASGKPHWTYTYTAVTGTLGANSKPLGAGTYTVKVTYNDDANSGEKTFPFTVKQADINVVLDTKPTNTSSYTYGNAMTFTAEISPASAADGMRAHLCIDGDNQNVVPTTVSDGTTAVMTFVCPTAGKYPSIGQHTVTVKQDTVWQGNYKAATSNAVALTLTAKPLTATATKVYDGTKGFTSANLTLVGKESYLSGGATVTDDVTGTIPNFDTTSANVGSYTVTSPAVTLAGTRQAWYTAPTAVAVTITAKTVSAPNITITAAPATYVYTGSAIVPTNVVVMDGDKVIPESEYTLSYSGNTNAGQATITVTDKDGGNYTVSGTGHFTISPKELTVTAAATDHLYDGDKNEPLTFGTLEGVVERDTVSLANQPLGTIATKDAEVARKPVTIPTLTLAGADMDNYALTQPTGVTVLVSKKPAAVKVDDVRKLYLAELPALTFSCTDIVGLEGPEALGVTLSTTATKTSDAGTYPITGTASEDTNYAVTITPGTFTVEQDRIVLEDQAVSAQIGGSHRVDIGALVAGKAGTLTYQIFNVADTDAVLSGAPSFDENGVLSFAIKAGATPGQTATIAVGVDGFTNYLQALTDVVVTISDKTAVTVNMDTIALENKDYDGTAIAYIGVATGTYGESTPYAGGFTYEWYQGGNKLSEAPKAAGSYTLKATVSDSAYAGVGTKDVTITKRTATVTADNKEMLIGATEPAYTATTSNLANGESISDVNFSVTGKNTAQKGNYAIVPAGGIITGGNENYAISYVSGSLTVTVDVTAINAAITDANTAKTDVTANENEASAVDSGTKFVKAAELKALTDAIQTATDAKATVVNAQQAADAAAALTNALSTFTAAIKTGTYVPSTGNPRPVPKPEPPKTDAVTGNTEVSVSVKPSTKGDTSSATVPDKSIQNAIAAAEKEAKKTGGSASVTVNVDAPEGAKTVETTLPSKSLTAVADGKTDGLKISTPVADLSFDDQALKNIAALAGKDVKISASQVDTDGLTDAQREQVGDAPVFDFTVTSDGKTISDFGGGTATVTVPYTPKDGENPEFVTVWLLDDAGKLIPIEAKYADGKITFETGHFSRYAVGYLPFTDVKADWAYESIVYAYQNKLFAGVGENKFAPDANMSRAMLWSVLYRMAGSPDKSEASATWYADAQKWVIANGISDGANPEGSVTREQLATILFRYAKATASTADMSKFADTTDISEFAKEGMTWAVETQILQGSEGKLNPQGTATRAEVATMLQRFAGVGK